VNHQSNLPDPPALSTRIKKRQATFKRITKL
jgi:hypothetical protein